MDDPRDFLRSSGPEPHRSRTREILRAHPEVRALTGQNACSGAIILVLVAAQSALAWWLHGQPFCRIALLAYVLGAFANHALFVMIHESAHNLIFRSRRNNRWAAILANLPLVIPCAVSFSRYHLKHHAFQGVHELDADLPDRWEARWVRTPTRKALWLLLFPLVQVVRTARLKAIKPVDSWVLINWLAQLSWNVLIYRWLGPGALIYLGLSLLFSVGLHPLGARWIQEYYVVAPGQATYSYYGPLNLVNFNVGYHNEHHDFPSVPWHRLPRVRSLAREHYDSLVHHRSLTRLLARFLTDPELSLYDRVVRSPKK